MGWVQPFTRTVGRPDRPWLTVVRGGVEHQRHGTAQGPNGAGARTAQGQAARNARQRQMPDSANARQRECQTAPNAERRGCRTARNAKGRVNGASAAPPSLLNGRPRSAPVYAHCGIWRSVAFGALWHLALSGIWRRLAFGAVYQFALSGSSRLLQLARRNLLSFFSAFRSGFGRRSPMGAAPGRRLSRGRRNV